MPRAAQRVLVPVADRLVRDVAAGHHQRCPGIGGQQVVQRRVGEHHAQLGGARRDGGGDRRRGSRGASTIGRSGRSSIARSRAPSSTRSAAASAEATISANGLSSRCLRDRSSATAPGSSARQARWYPPTPLTATIRPASSASTAAASGRRPGRSGVAVGPQQRQRRPAVGAGVGLGVEPAVGGVVVLRLAAGAHPEPGHGRRRPVIGHPADDREPRAAVGAVDERVAVAAVVRIEQLVQAVAAGRRVRRDRGPGDAARRALDDLEPGMADRLAFLAQHAVDHGQRRRLVSQAHDEPVDHRVVALDLDQHARASR